MVNPAPPRECRGVMLAEQSELGKWQPRWGCSVEWAYGVRRTSMGQASRTLVVLALSTCALFAPVAAAQDEPNAQDQPQLVKTGSSAAGRVPVEGAPDAVAERVKGLQREEAVPETLFEARRQAERAAAIVSTVMESEGYYQAEVSPSPKARTRSAGVFVSRPAPSSSMPGRHRLYRRDDPIRRPSPNSIRCSHRSRPACPPCANP